LDQFQRGNLKAEAEWTQLWLAAALARSGKEKDALLYLQAISDILLKEKGDTPLVHMLRHANPWLKNLQPSPLTADIARRVSETNQHLPNLRRNLRRHLSTAPLRTSRLTIQALGKPQVRINGKLVSSSQWHTLSVRDLFFLFLVYSRPLSKDEIGETFWPDIDPALLKLRFKNNIYRLRHALGQDVILFEENAYFFNHHLDYEYDVEDFENHLAQVRLVEGNENKIFHLNSAVKLWHGTFLQDVDANWVWPERLRLEQACLGAFWQLAELHSSAGDLESALQDCQHALEINPCLEEFHRMAMRLQAQQGNQLGVIWQYQACQEALHVRMDDQPSPETRDLYQRLIE
jgi:DNA-binding SARP family transcriptional activator